MDRAWGMGCQLFASDLPTPSLTDGLQQTFNYHRIAWLMTRLQPEEISTPDARIPVRGGGGNGGNLALIPITEWQEIVRTHSVRVSMKFATSNMQHVNRNEVAVDLLRNICTSPCAGRHPEASKSRERTLARK